ncbi:tetratricopeptide repeat protein [Peribacillus saganii]|uniref:Tetratricopeptide repeat protein n=1 Tax=Peribacillus saganii TaxID=2303992 RepID=A0A372LTK2_9BACI|nr:tetratricopeptide repeat protein [Peribacillus saganii]RFU71545.1 tetratricopeptide repeat protein [Peribacillus saganii]
MKEKRSGGKEDKKVIPFPKLANRLVEMGLESLSVKDFKRAAELFRQAKELEPEDPDLNVGLVVSLVELGFYEEAKELCKELLHKGIGDYFQVVNIYLMILLQLNEQEEMASTIEALLDDNQVPPDKVDHFEKMLQFSRRSVAEKERQREAAREREEQSFNESLLSGKSEQELLLTISRLSSMNARPYRDQIKEFFEDETGHPFFKTLLVNILREQEFEIELMIEKFGMQKTIIPAKLPEMKSNPFYNEISRLLERELEDVNPTLFELASGLLERHHFLYYPFDPGGEAFEEWAAAYHYLSEEYQGFEPSLSVIAEHYQCETEAVKKIVSRLKEIEEISYPII